MIFEIGKKISGPTFLNYVLWVIQNAQKRNIKVLYFLARDGFLLCKIAQIICKKCCVDIECRYLYCSRYSLRLPSYHLIGEEAYDLIFANSNEINLNILFERIGLTKNEIEDIKKSVHIEIDSNQKLTVTELKDLRINLADNAVFNEALYKKSQFVYSEIISYFEQENLFEHKHIGIVDSGWTGSMQRSFRQILEHKGHNCKITGFYFGLFFTPNDKKDGEYLGWYFDSNKGFWRKVLFCNNVIECLLSAPHEMTIGYRNDGEAFVPIQKETKDKEKFYEIVNKHIAGCLQYVEENIKNISLEEFDNDKAITSTYMLLRRFLVFPNAKEVSAFDSYMFCDDTSESYYMSLSGKNSVNLLSGYLMLPRIFRKFFNIKTDKKVVGLFWPYGTAAYLPMISRFWYRVNIICWESLRYFFLKR